MPRSSRWSASPGDEEGAQCAGWSKRPDRRSPRWAICSASAGRAPRQRVVEQAHGYGDALVAHVPQAHQQAARARAVERVRQADDAFARQDAAPARCGSRRRPPAGRAGACARSRGPAGNRPRSRQAPARCASARAGSRRSRRASREVQRLELSQRLLLELGLGGVQQRQRMRGVGGDVARAPALPRPEAAAVSARRTRRRSACWPSRPACGPRVGAARSGARAEAVSDGATDGNGTDRPGRPRPTSSARRTAACAGPSSGTITQTAAGQVRTSGPSSSSPSCARPPATRRAGSRVGGRGPQAPTRSASAGASATRDRVAPSRWLSTRSRLPASAYSTTAIPGGNAGSAATRPPAAPAPLRVAAHVLVLVLGLGDGPSQRPPLLAVERLLAQAPLQQAQPGQRLALLRRGLGPPPARAMPQPQLAGASLLQHLPGANGFAPRGQPARGTRGGRAGHRQSQQAQPEAVDGQHALEVAACGAGSPRSGSGARSSWLSAASIARPAGRATEWRCREVARCLRSVRSHAPRPRPPRPRRPSAASASARWSSAPPSAWGSSPFCASAAVVRRRQRGRRVPARRSRRDRVRRDVDAPARIAVRARAPRGIQRQLVRLPAATLRVRVTRQQAQQLDRRIGSSASSAMRRAGGASPPPARGRPAPRAARPGSTSGPVM